MGRTLPVITARKESSFKVGHVSKCQSVQALTKLVSKMPSRRVQGSALQALLHLARSLKGRGSRPEVNHLVQLIADKGLGEVGSSKDATLVQSIWALGLLKAAPTPLMQVHHQGRVNG